MFLEPLKTRTTLHFLLAALVVEQTEGAVFDFLRNFADFRAVAEITATLRKAGHRLIDLPENEIKELHRLGTSSVMKSNVQSGGYLVMEHINASGEPVVPRTATRSPASFLITPEIFANHVVRREVAQRYNNLWTQLRLDAIISPAVAYPAPPHGTYVSNAYLSIYNMLDYVTGSVPVTRVDLDLDVASSEWYKSEAYLRIKKTRFPYDWGDKEIKHLYKGLHEYKDSLVGIQVVCQRLREEKLIGILKEVKALTSSLNS
ncbi:amidase signature domain-containing protein [Boeremia exigua]|uniref:amidase signature domain-containing protein n=1 Tax=Boeremia exigua TaxID=749465 RepID=UPI001E8DA13D|nr:amidase signature domain-containing protein [Boeremia exigua]KAH6625932.1 amidase signature domain-containing protein [Boeremia exigua]